LIVTVRVSTATVVPFAMLTTLRDDSRNQVLTNASVAPPFRPVQ